jgi:hypothetical protein
MRMIKFLSLVAHIVVLPFKTRARLEAEIIFLRHQLNVLRRRAPSKPRLTIADRMILVWLYRLFPSGVERRHHHPPTLSSGGIAPAFAITGDGSRALAAVGQRFQWRFGG